MNNEELREYEECGLVMTAQRKRIEELEAALAHQTRCREDSDQKLMEADDALNATAYQLAEAREDSARWKGRYYHLRKLTEAALPDNMGGYPDLFYPDGFNGSNDSDHPWELWQSAVQIEAKHVDAAIKERP